MAGIRLVMVQNYNTEYIITYISVIDKTKISYIGHVIVIDVQLQ